MRKKKEESDYDKFV